MRFFTSKLKKPVLFRLFISYALLFTIPVIIISSILLYSLINTNYRRVREEFEGNLLNISDVFNSNTEKLTEFSSQLIQMNWVLRLNMASYDLGDSSDIYTLHQRQNEMNLYKSVNGFADDIVILFRIILPLCMPILSVLVLFYAVGQWNSFFNALIFLPSGKLHPLQIFLRRVLIGASEELAEDVASGLERSAVVVQLRYAAIMVTVLPIIMVYPFLQKYFTKGVMVGAIKG